MTGPPTRRLIVNADDFGQTPGINEGIIQCHERGIVTSASLMVRWPAARPAAAYARANAGLSVGLHLDLGEWICRNDEWTELYSVVLDEEPDTLSAETARQLEAFRGLMNADPTHIDSHQHVHRSAPFDAIVDELGTTMGVPVRRRSDAIQYVGGFYGQGRDGASLRGAISVEHLVEILRALPDGTTELGCHPGLRHDAPGMYVAEREQEVSVLCDPRVRAAIAAEGIELISFREAGAPSPLPVRSA